MLSTRCPERALLAADVRVGLKQKMKANQETVAAVSEKIQNLNSVIDGVLNHCKSRAERLHMTPEERKKMCENLYGSNGWKERVEHLQK